MGQPTKHSPVERLEEKGAESSLISHLKDEYLIRQSLNGLDNVQVSPAEKQLERQSNSDRMEQVHEPTTLTATVPTRSVVNSRVKIIQRRSS
jgi:hypothetical protein